MSCKNCEKRVLGCHSTCEEYLAYKKSVGEVKEKRREARQYHIYMSERFKQMQKEERWHHKNKK